MALVEFGRRFAEEMTYFTEHPIKSVASLVHNHRWIPLGIGIGWILAYNLMALR